MYQLPKETWTKADLTYNERQGGIIYTNIPENARGPLPGVKMQGGSVIGSGAFMVNGQQVKSTKFNLKQRKQIHKFYTSFSGLSTPVDKIVADTMSKGMRMTVKIGKEEIEFSSENTDTIEYYTHVLIPTVRTMLTEFLLYGYTMVRKVSPFISDTEDLFGYKHLPRLVVQPYKLVDAYIIWGAANSRSYILVSNDADPMHSDVSVGEEIVDGEVIIKTPPDDDGSLLSAPAKVLTDITLDQVLWKYYQTASFESSNPAVPIESGDRGVGRNRNTGDDSTVNSLSVLLNGEALLSKSEKDRAKYGTFDLEQANAERQRASVLEFQSKSVPTSSPYIIGDGTVSSTDLSIESIRAVESRPAIVRKFVLPAGLKTGVPIESKFPQAFERIIEIIGNRIGQAFGVPVAIQSSSKAGRYADNANLTKDIYRNTIMDVKGTCEMLIQDALSRLFKEWVQTDSFISAYGSAVDKKDVVVTFRFIFDPMVGLPALQALFKEGIIKPKSYQHYAAQTVGLPKEDLEPDFEAARLKRNSDGTKPTTTSSSSSSSSSSLQKTLSPDTKRQRTN